MQTVKNRKSGIYFHFAQLQLCAPTHFYNNRKNTFLYIHSYSSSSVEAAQLHTYKHLQLMDPHQTAESCAQNCVCLCVFVCIGVRREFILKLYILGKIAVHGLLDKCFHVLVCN